MKTEHLCIYLDDQYMPLVTVISVPIPVTAQSLKHKVARWAWNLLYSKDDPPEDDNELLDPEGEHLSIVGLDEGRLDEIKWFEVNKAFGKKKLNKRFNTHGESDEAREAYNQANFETCKEFAIE